jgi:hypothetical protein
MTGRCAVTAAPALWTESIVAERGFLFGRERPAIGHAALDYVAYALAGRGGGRDPDSAIRAWLTRAEALLRFEAELRRERALAA